MDKAELMIRLMKLRLRCSRASAAALVRGAWGRRPPRAASGASLPPPASVPEERRSHTDPVNGGDSDPVFQKGWKWGSAGRCLGLAAHFLSLSNDSEEYHLCLAPACTKL